MASVCKDPGGSHRICFMGADGKRRTIWLGVCPLTAARHVASRVQQLVNDQKLGVRHDANLTQWLRSWPAPLKSKLAKAGLAEDAGEAMTVTQLFERITKTSDIAPATAKIYARICASLVESLCGDTRIDRISAVDADNWQASLRERKLARATVAKYTNCVRGVFNRAVGWRMLETSPFARLKAGSQRNPSRQAYVSVEDFRAILAMEPDAKWRATFALLRFGGLRCPSELRGLQWSDMDLRPGELRLRVRSPKTEHHEGREQRTVPIIPELQHYLHEYASGCGKRNGLVFPELPSAVNLRHRLQRLLTKTGVPQWPRLFQNLRASYATDLVDRVPAHVAAAWCGHTVEVQQSAYMIQRDAHFRAATQGRSLLGTNSATDIAATAQNSAPHPIAPNGAESQGHP